MSSTEKVISNFNQRPRGCKENPVTSQQRFRSPEISWNQAQSSSWSCRKRPCISHLFEQKKGCSLKSWTWFRRNSIARNCANARNVINHQRSESWPVGSRNYYSASNSETFRWTGWLIYKFLASLTDHIVFVFVKKVNKKLFHLMFYPLDGERG